MHRRHTLTAAMTVALLLTACADDSNDSTTTTEAPATTMAPTTTNSVPAAAPDGIVLVEGLTEPAELAATLNDYSGYVVVDTETPVPELDAVLGSRTEWHPDGSMYQESEHEAGKFISIVLPDGTYFYKDVTSDNPDAGWIKSAYPQSESGPFGLLFGDVAGEDALEATDTGYRYIYTAGSESSMTMEFVVDETRVLTEVRYIYTEGEAGPISRFTYPETLPALTAPAEYTDGTDVNATLAESTLRDASATLLLLLTDNAISDITVDTFTDSLGRDDVYVNPDSSFDPYTIGFANDGTTIELVVSDGSQNCHRATFNDGGMLESSTVDQSGAMSDLGFTCGTNTLNAGG